MPTLQGRLRLSALLIFTLALPAFAQDAPATDVTAADAETMTVVVTAVRGMVQVRADENAKWQRAKPGMELTQGAEFRTGPRSAVEFKIPPDQTCVLDRLGTMKVLQAIRQGDNVKTDLGMKYGRTRYNIEAGGNLEHESTIRSPSATLAVRGTDVTFADEMGFPAMAQWNAVGFDAGKHDSQAQLTSNDTGKTQTFGGGGTDSQTNTGSKSAAAAALTTTAPSQQRGQTKTEKQTVVAAGGGGATTSGGNKVGGELQSQQQRNIGTRQAFNNAVEFQKRPGRLEVRLIWDDNTADLDVFSQTKLTTGATERLASSNPPDDPVTFQEPPPLSQIPPRLNTLSGGKFTQTASGSANSGQTGFTEVITFDKNGTSPIITDGFIGVRRVKQTGPLNESTPFTVQVLFNGSVVSERSGVVTEPDNQGRGGFVHIGFDTTNGLAEIPGGAVGTD